MNKSGDIFSESGLSHVAEWGYFFGERTFFLASGVGGEDKGGMKRIS